MTALIAGLARSSIDDPAEKAGVGRVFGQCLESEEVAVDFHENSDTERCAQHAVRVDGGLWSSAGMTSAIPVRILCGGDGNTGSAISMEALHGARICSWYKLGII